MFRYLRRPLGPWRATQSLGLGPEKSENCGITPSFLTLKTFVEDLIAF